MSYALGPALDQARSPPTYTKLVEHALLVAAMRNFCQATSPKNCEPPSAKKDYLIMRSSMLKGSAPEPNIEERFFGNLFLQRLGGM